MKYMGSKSRIKKYILPLIQNEIDSNSIVEYIEPFCGGCNIIDDIVCNKRIASDLSEPLIELWKAIQNNMELPYDVDRDFYNDVRLNKDNDKYEKYVIGAVGFLASYNGRYFDGGYAKPSEKRNYYDEAKRNILAQRDKIIGVDFMCRNYYDIDDSTTNALIYCDIPYKDTKQYATSKNFDHDRFWDWARNMSKNNIVIISELNAPDDFECIWEQPVLRSIKSTDKSIAIERLFKINEQGR